MIIISVIITYSKIPSKYDHYVSYSTAYTKYDYYISYNCLYSVITIIKSIASTQCMTEQKTCLHKMLLLHFFMTQSGQSPIT